MRFESPEASPETNATQSVELQTPSGSWEPLEVIVRFVGDPIGYCATIRSPTPPLDKPYWVRTTEGAVIDVAKAYLIEKRS